MTDDEILDLWASAYFNGSPTQILFARMIEARTIERCAEVCESLINEETCYVWIPDSKGAIEECAATIRALKDDRG